MKKAILYNRKGDKAICTACKWYCAIANNFVGVCGIRLNKGGDLYLLTHSHTVSCNLDPIEKKPLYHFLPGSKVFSIGTYGCNFACDFCQNWEISQTPKLLRTQLLRQGKIKEFSAELKKFIEMNSIYLPSEEIVKRTLETKAPSIAFTYNEPTIFAEYAYDTMKLARKYDLFGVFVSSGYESKETLDLLEEYIDAYNIDLKGASEQFYQKVCHTKLKPVLSTIEEIVKRGKWIEITTLLIPGLNTKRKDLRFIARFIASLSKDIPWHVSAFYPHYKLGHIPPTPYKTLMKAYDIGKREGLKFVYTGNIPNKKTESTYCPNCCSRLINRFAYKVNIDNLDTERGRCKKCDTKIPGIWNSDLKITPN